MTELTESPRTCDVLKASSGEARADNAVLSTSARAAKDFGDAVTVGASASWASSRSPPRTFPQSGHARSHRGLHAVVEIVAHALRLDEARRGHH
jgi:hypothetical protein